MRAFAVQKVTSNHRKPSDLPTNCPYCYKYISRRRNLKGHVDVCKMHKAMGITGKIKRTMKKN